MACHARRRPGSSPRVRGKFSLSADSVKVKGLIPACAGKIATPSPTLAAVRAHPRVCGENRVHVRPTPSKSGSSPRVRGKSATCAGGCTPRGLIPACAGKINAAETKFSPPAAHPRVCGENRPANPAPRIGIGSSPRVRGKLAAGEFDCCGLRLIPACAGKTVEPPGDQAPGGAHPRVCGENLSGDQEAMVEAGSSPRVRGKRGPLTDRPRPPRLIPACAGKTASRPADPDATRAHPRVCGENSIEAGRS